MGRFTVEDVTDAVQEAMQSMTLEPETVTPVIAEPLLAEPAPAEEQVGRFVVSDT